MQTSQIDARSGELMTIPLSLLVPSGKWNVRTVGGENVDDLKASIEAQGLLQNLIVCPAPMRKGWREQRYEVVGGRRRLRALVALAAERRISVDEEILCRVKPTREAAEASLAENYHREPMHPADEFEAFQRLVQEGRSVEEVAQRFGTSPITVRRRLKLADVHPELRQLYREDGITMEQLMALALSDDPDEQLRAWNGTPAWRRDPHALRSMFVTDEVDVSTDALGRFVGIEAYEAAGGAVRRDLFSEQGQGYLRDPMLLLQLANAKLDAAAAPVREEGWSWVEVVQRASSLELYRFGRAPKSQRAMTKREAKESKALNRQLAEWEGQLRGEIDDEDEDEADRLQQACDEVQDKLQTLEDSLSTYDTEAMAASGAIVCVSRDGRPEIIRGLIRPEDRADAARGAKRSASGGDDAGDPTESRTKPTHSASLMRELTGHRTLAARAAMLERPDVALTALLHCLVQRLLRDVYVSAPTAVRLISHEADAGLVPKAGGTLGEARAAGVIEGTRERWGERIPGDPEKLLPWLAELADTDRMELLALCVAMNLNDVHDDERAGPLDPLCAMLGLDMADWWEAKEATYFQRVTKDAIAKAITEAAGADVAARYKGVSKAELARVAERDLSGKRWLPAPFRTSAEQAS
jgi:ParB family chromosome partitioning protein